MKKFVHIDDDDDDRLLVRSACKIITSRQRIMPGMSESLYSATAMLLTGIEWARDEHDSNDGKWHRPLMPKQNTHFPSHSTTRRQLSKIVCIFFCFWFFFWYGLFAAAIIIIYSSLAPQSSPKHRSIHICVSRARKFPCAIHFRCYFSMVPLDAFALLYVAIIVIIRYEYYRCCWSITCILSSLLFLRLLRADRVRRL